MKNHWLWNIDDLERLVDQTESYPMEFKESRLFEKSHNQIADTLSKEASAFANT